MKYTKGEQCSKMISGDGPWGAFHQRKCSNKAVLERDGKPYCKIHDPEYRKQKSIERKVRWDREREENKARQKRKSLITSIFDGTDTEVIEANKDKYRAAPDLYEACLSALGVMATLDQSKGWVKEIAGVIRQALAKAEGK